MAEQQDALSAVLTMSEEGFKASERVEAVVENEIIDVIDSMKELFKSTPKEKRLETLKTILIDMFRPAIRNQAKYALATKKNGGSAKSVSYQRGKIADLVFAALALGDILNIEIPLNGYKKSPAAAYYEERASQHFGEDISNDDIKAAKDIKATQKIKRILNNTKLLSEALDNLIADIDGEQAKDKNTAEYFIRNGGDIKSYLSTSELQTKYNTVLDILTK